ncbi:unnamed protein product [Prorocentrum cordatum]|uniref:glucan 1,3-beta-glucosidase n=1 Tax=Prorocentrum cordatum TaxID=2364126 RepID=A0ABN9QD82_9DINO|nr:unnamed protein product [Polarella glacialis]
MTHGRSRTATDRPRAREGRGEEASLLLAAPSEGAPGRPWRRRPLPAGALVAAAVAGLLVTSSVGSLWRRPVSPHSGLARPIEGAALDQDEVEKPPEVKRLRDEPAVAQEGPRFSTVPDGTNFGGWLLLEEWMSSGGKCLPPLLPSKDIPALTWASEGDLGFKLNESVGPTEAIKVFARHRETFISNQDLEMVKALGIKYVRVPLGWHTFPEALAIVDVNIYAKHDLEEESVVIPDPYWHSNISYATVPRKLLRQFLKHAKQLDLGVMLDLHAMPGGSSAASYNGVAPNPPMFWLKNSRIGNTSISLQRCGQYVVQAVVDFVQSLDTEHSSVIGVTLMNEPALVAWPYYSHVDDVLSWLAAGARTFRDSTLPSNGVRLYVNLQKQMLALEERESFWDTVVPWFKRTFNDDERNSWAYFDMHYYIAWNRTCGGCTNWTQQASCPGTWPAWGLDPPGGFACSSKPSDISEIARSCVTDFISEISHYINTKKAVSELSVGTWTEPTVACKERSVVEAVLNDQITSFGNAGIEHYFWSWRTPFSPEYEPGWSLRWLSRREDKSTQQCK